MERPGGSEQPYGVLTSQGAGADDLVAEIHARLEQYGVQGPMLERLFALAPMGFQLYDATGRSLFTNQAFIQMFGSSPPPEYNVMEDEIAERAGVLGLIRRAFAGEVVRVPPVWYDPRELKKVKVSGGRRVAIDATFFPVFDVEGPVTHVGVVFKDVTAEFIAREEAESERDLLRAIVQQSGDGIIVADAQGRLRIFNPEAARQHGRSFENVAAEQWTQAYGLETEDGRPLSLERTALWRALHGETVTNAYWTIRRPDGSRRLLVGTATPVHRPDGALYGAMIITRDETERRHIAEERRIAEFKDRVIGILGHDLRVPLASIKASAKLLARSHDVTHAEWRDAVERAVQRIDVSADRMTRMIADVLDFTRARIGGGIPIDRQPADLAAVTLAVVEEFRAIAPNSEIRLESRGPLWGNWDADRLAQVVQNLVDNALVYGAANAPVEVTLDGTRPEEVEVAVHSSGPPMSPLTRTQVFDPFRRGTDAAPGRPKGLGLGLFIVRSLVEAHGGRIDVASGSPDGTTFTVRLPRD